MLWLDPAVLAASTAGRAGDAGSQGYYLGVAHFHEPSEGSRGKDGKTYRHFLIKVEAQPPFKVLQVCQRIAELPQALQPATSASNTRVISWFGSTCCSLAA